MVWVCFTSLFGQKEPELIIDSLKTELQQLSTMASLRERIALGNKIGRAYEGVHLDSAIAWYKKQAQLLTDASLKSPDKDSLLGATFLDISYLHTTYAYPTEEIAKSGLAYSDSAIKTLSLTNQTARVGYAYNNKGCFYYNLGDYDASVKALIKAFELSESLENERQKGYLQQSLWLNIGRSQIGLEEWDRAIVSTKKALHRHNHLPFVNACQLNLSAMYLEKDEIDSALYYSQKAYQTADSLGYEQNKLLSSVNLAECLVAQKRADEALKIINENIEAADGTPSYLSLMAASLHQKGVVMKLKGEMKYALALLHQALDYAKQITDAEMQQDIYGNLADYYYLTDNFKEAYRYSKQFTLIKDSLRSVENTTNYNNLLVRYESSEKERKIAEQDLELQTKAATIAIQKNRTWLISALALALVLGGLLGFFRFRHLQERRYKNAIIEEKEKGMAAILSATEEERKRISKDLHDGIGQKLTALRLGLLGITKKVKDKTYRSELEQITSQFSESAEEVRQISHQMMPRALMENGLLQALEDLIENTFKFSNIKYQFEYNNVDKRYPEKIEISLYRIAQELLGNALKHSKATEIQVQLMEVQNKLILIVEDNGRGIAKGNSRGQGLYNINSRLDLVKGIVTFEPAPNTGMLATVNVPLS